MEPAPNPRYSVGS